MNNKPSESPVLKAMEKRLLKIIDPPAQPVQIKRPRNNLWIAKLSFYLLFAFLDLITAITVGALTMWYYGVLVFLAGFVPMVVHEQMFTRPYAHNTQKWVAIAGVLLGAFSTVAIGVAVGVVNVLKLTNLFGSGTVELAMIVGLVIIAALHAVLFGVYVFIDHGTQSNQKYANSLANHDIQTRDLALASVIVSELKKMGADLQIHIDNGDGALIGAALKKVSGTNILEDDENSNTSPIQMNLGRQMAADTTRAELKDKENP